VLLVVFTSSDSYTTYKDTYNSANEGAASVLANDFDTDGQPLTASLVSGPSHGSVVMHTDGSFVYTPNSGFTGSDSFVYQAADSVASANATATITVSNAFGAQVNAPDQPFAGVIAESPFATSQLTAAALTPYALGHGHDLTYNSLTADVMPIISVETAVGSSGGGTTVPVPDSIEMHATFGGLTASTLYFNNSGITAGNDVYFADQLDASSLATGHYQYQVTLIAHYGSTTSTRVFSGYQDIVNRQSSEFGPGWTLAELDKLAVGGTGGVLWAGGTGGTAWFTDTGGGTYSSPAGPMAFSTLTKSGSNYILTDKFGNVENFNSTDK
jgi:hypothetical protein